MPWPAIAPILRRASFSEHGDSQHAAARLAALPDPIKLNSDTHIATEDLKSILSFLPHHMVSDMFASAISNNQPQAWKIVERYNEYIIPKRIEWARQGSVHDLKLLPGPFVKHRLITWLSTADVSELLQYLPSPTVIEMFTSVIASDQSLGWTVARFFNIYIIKRRWRLTKLVQEKEEEAAGGKPKAPASNTASITYGGRDIPVTVAWKILARLSLNDYLREFSNDELE